MNSIAISIVSAGCIFCGTLVGFWLQKRLPDHHLNKDSHEIVKLGAGMIAMLTALVLGLLVGSAKGTFDTINAGIKQMSARIVLMDRMLAQYGPESGAVRDQIRSSLLAGIQTVWPQNEGEFELKAAATRSNRVDKVQVRLRELTPQTETQRQLLTQVQQLAADMSQNRWLMLEEAQSQLPTPLLVILIFWLTALFLSFGLFAPRNGTVAAVLLVCACSVATAIFLVMEMNRPLEGFVKVSNAPLRDALQQIGH
jgi:ABC-type multidrug transport system fused ATPase/permease subunit